MWPTLVLLGSWAGAQPRIEVPLPDEMRVNELALESSQLKWTAEHTQSEAPWKALRRALVESAGPAQEAKAARSDEEVEAEATALEVSKPESVAAFYTTWMQKVDLDKANGATRYLAMRVCSLVAHLHAYEMNDKAKAVEMYEWGMQEFGKDGGAVRLRYERVKLLHPHPNAVRKVQVQDKPQGAGQSVASIAPIEAPRTITGVTVPPIVATGASTVQPLVSQPLGGQVVLSRALPPVPSAISPLVLAAPGEKAGGALALSEVLPDWRTTAVRGTASTAAVVMRPSIVQGKAGAAVASVTFNGGHARRDGALVRIKAGKQTAQQAWTSGALNYDNLADFFQNGTGDWVITDRKTDNGMHHALIALLLTQEKTRMETLKVPPKLRLWLADYYWTQRDARSVAVAESILSEVKEPVKGENPLVFQAVERQAWFYSDTNQYEKGAQYWLRMEKFHAESGWWVPDALIQAARLYQTLGQEQKAKELRDRVLKSSDPMFTGLVVYDQADTLINQGKHTQARALLQQPIVGDKGHWQWVKVGLLSLLAESYSRTEEVEAARRTAQSALDLYGALHDAPQDDGFKYQIQRAKEIIARSEGTGTKIQPVNAR
jgi:tetratricopeptide (TPR) repeat protein